VSTPESPKPDATLLLDADVAAAAGAKAAEAGVEVPVFLNALLRNAMELPRRPPTKLGRSGGSAT
jgi:hypothetical protein